VDDSLFMHRLQRLYNRHHHGDGFIRGNSIFLFQTFGQCFAVQELHDDIGGVIIGETVKNFNNTL
jgi:hypothetical protein